jgi:hypothetical protein
MPRELIDTGRSKRFVRRDAQGQFDEVADVGRSLSRDTKQKAKRTVRSGEGDRGDQKPRQRRSAAGQARKKAAPGAGAKAKSRTGATKKAGARRSR